MSETLKGVKILNSWKDLIRFDNSNNGVPESLKDIYDGAGNVIPIQVSTSSVYLNNPTINETVFNNTGMTSPTINSGSLETVSPTCSAVVNLPTVFLDNFDISSIKTDKRFYGCTQTGGNAKITLDLGTSLYFIVDQTGVATTTDIEIINTSSRIFSPTNDPSGGYLEIIVYLFAYNNSVQLFENYPSTTPIFWNSPAVFPSTDVPSASTMTTGSCIFSLQTFDRGTTWYGFVLADSVYDPNVF